MNQSLVLDEVSLASRIREGTSALIPTDTLPALACLPDYAVNLWELKRRPASKPLILMGSEPEDLFKYVLELALTDAWKMAERYWPGALTLILPSSGGVAAALNPYSETLGMRIPDCKPTRLLFDRTGPLATTSANISGIESSHNEHEASACFPHLPLLGPLPWRESSSSASTILSWERVGTWKMLRAGQLAASLNLKNGFIES